MSPTWVESIKICEDYQADEPLLERVHNIRSWWNRKHKEDTAEGTELLYKDHHHWQDEL